MPKSSSSRRHAPHSSIVMPIEARFQLKSLLHFLNFDTRRVPVWLSDSEWEWNTVDISEFRMELRRIIGDWDKADRNLFKLYERRPDLRLRFSEGHTILVPTLAGKAQLAWFAYPKGLKTASTADAAMMRFTELLVNPLSEMLGGPCPRCDLYYIKHSKRQKVYCERRCGAATTAVSAARSKREADHAEKLQTAQRAMTKWGSIRRRNEGWKLWVSRSTGYTLTWLTRAVNRGELLVP
jgi:hypothetical protein